MAFIGFRTTKRVTDKTVAAGSQDTMRILNATRDDRLWEKRAAAYEEAIAYLLFRQFARSNLGSELAGRSYTEPPKSWFGNYEPPGWVVIQGRLLAYGSDEIVAANQEAHAANDRIAWSYERWRTLADKARQAIGDQDIINVQGGAHALGVAAQNVEEELKEAEEKDRVLIKLIRAELHSRPRI